MSTANSIFVLNATSPGIRASRRRTGSSVQLLGRYNSKSIGNVLRRCCDAEAHAELTVGDLSRRTRVLPLHPNRMRPLLEKTRVVDHPRRDRFSFAQRLQRVARRLQANRMIAPAAAPQRSADAYRASPSL